MATAEVVASEARALCETLSIDTPAVHEVDPDATWSASGAMELTGRPDEAPITPRAPIAARVHAAAQVLRSLSTVSVDGPALLGQRAKYLGLRRRGDTSAGGHCRLLPCRDGWVAVQLARASDVDVLPAWLGVTTPADVGEAIASCRADDVTARGQLFGVPVATLPAGETDEQLVARGQVDAARPFLVRHIGDTTTPSDDPVVVDLSSLWAGPLCAHLLGRAGARVVKVEALGRPDGARAGHPGFYALLHRGHRSVTIDFASQEGVTQLRRLIEAADVVIEASRPRALDQLEIRPEDVLARRSGVTWVSITGYGRTGPWSNRVAFGDDGAVAGGLVVHDDEGPMFVADAIADPATGLLAAVAVAASRSLGGGRHIDISLREVARHLAR